MTDNARQQRAERRADRNLTPHTNCADKIPDITMQWVLTFLVHLYGELEHASHIGHARRSMSACTWCGCAQNDRQTHMLEVFTSLVNRCVDKVLVKVASVRNQPDWMKFPFINATDVLQTRSCTVTYLGWGLGCLEAALSVGIGLFTIPPYWIRSLYLEMKTRQCLLQITF